MKHLILIIALLLLVGCKGKEAAVSESLKVEETKTQRMEEKLSSMLGLTIDSIVISLASPPALPSREGAQVSTLNSKLSTLNSQPTREGAEREGDSADIGLKPYAELYRPYGANTNAKANANAKAKANAKLFRPYSAKIYGIKAVKHDTLWREKIRRDTITKVETATIKEEQKDWLTLDRKIVLLVVLLGIILICIFSIRKTGV